MNNQFQNNQQNNYDQNSINDLIRVLQATNQLSIHQEQRFLFIIIDHLQKKLMQKNNDIFCSPLKHNQNLSLAIYEKCLQLQQKNQKLKIDVLNLKATLTKLMSHSKQSSSKQKTYEQIIQNIRKKRSNIATKLEKYRDRKISYIQPKNEQVNQRVVQQLKNGTTWLQKQTIELKRQVEVWNNYCSNQSTYRN